MTYLWALINMLIRYNICPTQNPPENRKIQLNHDIQIWQMHLLDTKAWTDYLQTESKNV